MAKKQTRPLQARQPALARFGGGSGKQKDVQIMGQDEIIQVVQPGQLDAITLALLTINYEHHEIHGGSHYFYENFATVESGVTYSVEILTPDTAKWLHMEFIVKTDAGCVIELVEGAAASTGGTVVTAINNNRNSSNVSGAIIKSGVTPGAGGTSLLKRHIGSGSNPIQASPGEGQRSNEIILKQNTRYILKMTSEAAGNQVDWRLSWYEHTNK